MYLHFCNMDPKEALSHILNSCPANQIWCAVTPDEKEQVWLRVTALRIKRGNVKPDTLKKFFSYFGYEVEFSLKVKKAG